jgi:electron transport complex protein RnfG
MTNTKSGYYLRLALTLLLISAVVAGLLGLTNYVTADKILALTAEKTAASMQEVLPSDSYTELTYTGSETNVAAVYEAESGYVVEVTPSGFGGTIDMVVGVGTDGTVTGVSIISMSETSGLGANASKESFRSQYVGKSGELAVSKDGGEIDALTGATITSRAVTAGVNTALRVAGELMG